MPTGDFGADRQRVFALRRQGRFAEGLDLAEEVAEQYPERPAETAFWRACLLSLTGRTQEALESFRAALDRGVWWPKIMLETDPDLDPLRSLPGFADVLVGSDANLARARAGFPDHPEVRLHLPSESPKALLLVLHMLGATAETTEPHWRGADPGMAVAVLGSSQSTPDGQQSWEVDELVVRDVLLGRDEAIRAGVGAGVPVVLGGASQGGSWAIQLAIDGRVPARGFLAVVSGAPRSEDVAPHLGDAVRRGVQGWILNGELDQGAPATERLHRELVEAGLDVRLESVAGLGHEYPDDLPARLAGALVFVLADDRG
jgi:predicted esterase